METPSTNTEKTPRLSLIACSRNDQWQGNSLWRLQTSLNYAALQAAKLGRLDDVEIIVTDWGSSTRLLEAVRLTTDAARIVRFLNVPTELAKEMQRDSPFAEVIALNAAARRSRGDYIGRIDQDILVGRRFLEWFFAAIGPSGAPFRIASTVMISNRRRIPYSLAARCPPFPIVEKYIDLFGRILPRMRPPPPERYWECYIGILLLHRRLWEAAGGYDETFIYYGFMESDLFLRLRERFEGVDLGALVGCDFYHLDHIRTWSVWKTVERSLNPPRTPAEPPPQFCPNGEGWGLAAHDIPLASPVPSASARDGEVGWRFLGLARLLWITLVSATSTACWIGIEPLRDAAAAGGQWLLRLTGRAGLFETLKEIEFLRALSADLERARATLHHAVEDQVARGDALAARNDELTAWADSLLTELTSAKEQLTSARADESTLRQKITDQRHAFDGLQGNYAALETRYAEVQAEALQLRERLRALTSPGRTDELLRTPGDRVQGTGQRGE